MLVCSPITISDVLLIHSCRPSLQFSSIHSKYRPDCPLAILLIFDAFSDIEVSDSGPAERVGTSANVYIVEVLEYSVSMPSPFLAFTLKLYGVLLFKFVTSAVNDCVQLPTPSVQFS